MKRMAFLSTVLWLSGTCLWSQIPCANSTHSDFQAIDAFGFSTYASGGALYVSLEDILLIQRRDTEFWSWITMAMVCNGLVLGTLSTQRGNLPGDLNHDYQVDEVDGTMLEAHMNQTVAGLAE